MESVRKCPPPKELEEKHFNDKLLFVIESNQESHTLDRDQRIVVLKSNPLNLYSWSQPNIIIGRKSQGKCDLYLESKSVSKYHLWIGAKDGAGMYTVKDLELTNHSYIVSENQEQLMLNQEYKVPAGTVLRLANCYIVVL